MKIISVEKLRYEADDGFYRYELNFPNERQLLVSFTVTVNMHQRCSAVLPPQHLDLGRDASACSGTIIGVGTNVVHM